MIVRAIVLSLCITANAFAEQDGIVARSGDVKVTQDELRSEIAYIQKHRKLKQLPTLDTMLALTNQLLTSKLIAVDAKAAGIDQSEEARYALKRATEKELTRLMLEHIKAVELDEKTKNTLAHEYYLLHEDEFTVPEQRKLSHILIANKDRSEAEALEKAQKLLAELRENPDSFAAVAEANSDDAKSAARGGELGFGPKERYVKAFAEAAFALTRINEVSEPVKSPFGYHIIRLEGVRPAKLRTFDEVKEAATEKAVAEYLGARQTRYLNDIRSSGNRTVNRQPIKALHEEFFRDLKIPDAPQS